MANSSLDYILLAPARHFFSSLELAEQAEVVGLLADICLDPFVDGVRKFIFPTEVLVFTVYDDSRWVILYRLINDAVVQVYAIERADPARRQRRRY